jgi:predicted transcriptional regulator of viral defense system
MKKMPLANPSDRAKVLRLAAKSAVLRASDAHAAGVASVTLRRMVRTGELELLGEGRYWLSSKVASTTENHSLALACGAVDSAVVCLLTALRFHNIGTQLPRDIWIAVPPGARVPRLSYPPLRVTRMSAPLLDLGVEEHRIECQQVRVTGVSRTLADCFRFLNRVGLDVALEALVEARRSRRLNLNELDRIAVALRVDRVMRPYLQMLLVCM